MKTHHPFIISLLLTFCIAASARAAAPSDLGPSSPLITSTDATWLGETKALAVSPDGLRVYSGRMNSYDRQRRNLIVRSIVNGALESGRPRLFVDSVESLPPGNANSSVHAIVPHPRQRKLYLAYGVSSVIPSDASRLLSVYDLDASGEPVGKPRSYECGNPHRSLLALALHPKHDLLYGVGQGGEAVYVYRLDPKGEPTAEPKAFAAPGYGKHEIAVSADGKKLYLGTYPDVLEVMDLDDAGMPKGPPRRFPAGKISEWYLHFQYSARALYISMPTPDGAQLGMWPLDANGEPIGQPKRLDKISLSTFALDLARQRMWVAAPSTYRDAFTDRFIKDGVNLTLLPLNDEGTPGAALPESTIRFGEQGMSLAVAPEGNAVLVTKPLSPVENGSRVKDLRLRLTLLEGRTEAGAAPPTALFDLGYDNKQVRAGEAKLGEGTAWIPLDPVLRDRPAAVPLTILFRGGGPAGGKLSISTVSKLRVEVADGDPGAGGKVLKKIDEAVQGDHVILFLPGYGSSAEGRSALIETLPQHAHKYLDVARAAAVAPQDRPRQFVVSCYQIIGGQGSADQLKTSAEALSLLGFNTVNSYWWDGIPPEQVDAALDSFGLQRRSMAIYTPPSYFDYHRELMNPAALDKWVEKEFVKRLATDSGGAPADVVDVKLADEPGWYYPGMLDDLRGHAEGLVLFRERLKEKGFTPQEFGKTDWKEILPIGASAATDLPSRKLYYQTMWFFTESAARGHRMATEAIKRQLPGAKFIDVNWANWGNRWYVASPGKKVDNNPIIGPDSGRGNFDWMESGRRSAHSPWTEDWFSDQSANTWSLYGDLLRSSAMLGHGLPGQEQSGMDFGAYVVGQSIGAHSEGASLKMLSLLGHGGKAIDVYTWGPSTATGDAWSERFDVYKPVADALRRVGKAERFLFPGRPARGKVALALPGNSSLWEQAGERLPCYLQELWGLHAALTHAGYTVDFVDDTDLSAGAMKERGYTTLYLTGPNVAITAQAAVRAWVESGGTLAMTPGAAVADEYNTPTDAFDAVVGVRGRAAVRTWLDPNYSAEPQTAELKITDDRFRAAESAAQTSLAIRGPVALLKPSDPAAVSAGLLSAIAAPGAKPDTVPSPAEGILVHPLGKGTVISFGFYPGLQYLLSPDRQDPARLPLNWSKPHRDVAVAPARIAKTPRAVILGTEGVEACRLESGKGIALVLLNWTDEPVKDLTVEITDAKSFKTVTSTEQNRNVPATVVEGTLKLKIDVKSLDVLLIE